MDVCWISEYLQDDVVSNCIIQFAHCEAWYVALCNLQGINGGLLLSCQELFCLATLAFIVNCFSQRSSIIIQYWQNDTFSCTKQKTAS
jgi:hypothetical protein